MYNLVHYKYRANHCQIYKYYCCQWASFQANVAGYENSEKLKANNQHKQKMLTTHSILIYLLAMNSGLTEAQTCNTMVESLIQVKIRWNMYFRVVGMANWIYPHFLCLKLNSLQKTHRPLPFILSLTLCLIVPHVVKATGKAGMKAALMKTCFFFSKSK